MKTYKDNIQPVKQRANLLAFNIACKTSV